jgi:hypothetical protein
MMNLIFDIEGDGLRDTAKVVWCIVAKDIDTGKVYQFGPDEIQQGIILLGSATLLIGHNILNYDLPLLEKLYGFHYEGTVFDTLVCSRLLMSDRVHPGGTRSGTHSLAAWGYRVGRGKPDHDDWTQFSPEMMHRCTEDVEINALVYDALLMEWGTTINWWPAFQLEQDIAVIMTEQEDFGVPFKVDEAKALLATFTAEISQIDAELVPQLPPVPLPASRQGTWPRTQFKKDGSPTQAALRYYGPGFTSYRTDLIVKTEPINLASEKQVKEYLLSIGWEPIDWNYQKGSNGKPLRDEYGEKIKTSPKLTIESLESCEWPEGQATFGEKVVRRLMLAHRCGMLEGFLRDVRPDGRLSAQTTPQGTPTGRMTHRVVVNVPAHGKPYGAEMRALFGTDEGYIRAGLDLSSCQLRGLCHEMGDEEFQRQVIEGDIHTYAKDLAGLAERWQGKKLVYLTLFGGGPQKLATDLKLPLEQARVVQSTFFSNLPKLKELLDRLSREWKEGGCLKGLDGRALWVRAEHMLLVYRLQALEAVYMKSFLREMYQHKSIARQVTVNHDEGQFLVPIGYQDEFSYHAFNIRDRLNERFELRCPQDIDIKFGQNWAECH